MGKAIDRSEVEIDKYSLDSNNQEADKKILHKLACLIKYSLTYGDYFTTTPTLSENPFRPEAIKFVAAPFPQPDPWTCWLRSILFSSKVMSTDIGTQAHIMEEILKSELNPSDLQITLERSQHILQSAASRFRDNLCPFLEDEPSVLQKAF